MRPRMATKTASAAEVGLDCWTGPLLAESLDQDGLIRELLDGDADEEHAWWLNRRPISSYDVLVLARSRRDDRCLGLLGCQRRQTAAELFLEIETLFVAADARGCGLGRRLVATAMLHMAGRPPMPRVVAGRSATFAAYRQAHALAPRLTHSVLYPEPDERLVSLGSAALARRVAATIAPCLRFDVSSGTLRGGRAALGGLAPDIAPLSRDPALDALLRKPRNEADQTLVMLDLRAANEDRLIEELRAIYRGR
jgi:GNAT superfamily N-acetyltransferase